MAGWPIPSFAPSNLIFIQALIEDMQCSQCHEVISKGDLIVRTYENADFFHLRCFQQFPLRITSFDSAALVSDSIKKKELKEWIADWNKQFKSSDEVVKIVTQKQVKSEAPVHRRAFLESFKYLDTVTLVLVAGQVCKEWYHISWEDEIWRHLCQIAFPALQTNTDFRKAYLNTFFSSCIHCKKVLQDSERHMVCPLISRPKCYSCYKKWKNRPCQVNLLVDEFHCYNSALTPAVLEQFHIPTFTFDRCKCVYPYQILLKLGRRRKATVEEIVSREDRELDRLFGEKCFIVLLFSTKKDLVFGTVEDFQDKLGVRRISNNQRKLFSLILEGKTMNEFEALVTDLKEARGGRMHKTREGIWERGKEMH